jgi:membrane-associated protein
VHSLLDPTYLVKTFGYIGLFTVIFLESGIVFGFFLPGDSLLFAAGLLAAKGSLNIFAVIFIAFIAAVLGNNAGYYTGKKFGASVFKREPSWFLSKERVEQAHRFFDKYGGKSLLLARFIPAARTLVPIFAGIGRMDYRHFFTFNALGGLFWAILMPTLGYTLGKSVPSVDKYILPIIFIIIVLSVAPVTIHYLMHKEKHGRSS